MNNYKFKVDSLKEVLILERQKLDAELIDKNSKKVI